MNIYALIVTFNPNISAFSINLDAIAEQVQKVIIVDNSIDDSCINGLRSLHKDKNNVVLIQPNKNLGIAYAQNIGFLQAIKSGADYVITFDQDSSVQAGLINALYEEYGRVQKQTSVKIACIGPSVINERNDTLYEKYFRGSNEVCESIFSVKSIISSGTLYNTSVFSFIGLNKAEWFIDSIDIEWCYRARYLGYHVLMTKNVFMKHNLGSKDVELVAGKSINIGSPFRLYYVYRNWIFSLKQPQFEMKYKLKLLMLMPLKFLIFANIKPRRERILFMLRGIKDGLLNRHSFKD